MDSVPASQTEKDPKHEIGYFERLATHVRDLRDTPPDLFEDVSRINWKNLSWDEVNRPYKVDKWAEGKKLWEQEHGDSMPVKEGWQHFNKSFHQLFIKDVPQRKARNTI